MFIIDLMEKKSLNLEQDVDDGIYGIICAMIKVSPSLLVEVLENVTIQLHSQNVNIRIVAINLLGRLFKSSVAFYYTDYSFYFNQFLLCLDDDNVVIRILMVTIKCFT